MRRLKKVADQEESQSQSINKWKLNNEDIQQHQIHSSEEQPRGSIQQIKKRRRRKSKNNEEAQLHKDKTKRKTKNQLEKELKKQKVDAILTQLQKQFAQNDEEDDKSSSNDDHTCAEIPDCVLVQNKKKKKDGGVKFKNKLFDLEFEDHEEKSKSFNTSLLNGNPIHNELQGLENQYEKVSKEKQAKNQILSDLRKNKIQQRVNKIRERLQFKGARDDVRYLEDLKKSLNDVKDCENVNLIVEVPKIFKGASSKHTDGALFLKNISTQAANQSQDKTNDNIEEASIKKQDKQKEDKQVLGKKAKIDRKIFYSQFDQDLKQMKAMKYDEKKINFSKSSLDDLEIQFERNQHLFKEDQTNSFSRRSYSHDHQEQLSNRSRSISQTSSNSNKSKSLENCENNSSQTARSQKRKSVPLQSIPIVKQEKQNEDSKTNQQIKEQKQDEVGKKQKQNKEQKVGTQQNRDKHKKQRRKFKQRKEKHKTKEKFLKGLFEEEAQVQNETDHDNSSSQSDNQVVKDLVDDSQISLNKQNQRKARSKFILDEYAHEMNEIKRIKEQLAQQQKIRIQEDSQSRKRRERRINNAKKRIQEEDLEEAQFVVSQVDILFDENEEHNENQINTFEKQLNELESQINAKREEKQVQKTHDGAKINDVDTKKLVKKNPIDWKQVKSFVRVSKNIKRGGFGGNQSQIAGGKVQKKRNSKKSSKKDIVFTE